MFVNLPCMLLRAALAMVAAQFVVIKVGPTETARQKMRRASRSIRVVRRTRPLSYALSHDFYADRGGSDYARAYMARYNAKSSARSYVAPGTRRSPRTKRVSGLSARNQTRPAGHVQRAR